MRPSPPGPDLDADLSVILDRAESIPAWVAIWQARTEPDAHARRCASDAIAAADELLAATHRIRARLVTEVRRADDETAVRVDELLARRCDGPRPLTPTRGPPDLIARQERRSHALTGYARPPSDRRTVMGVKLMVEVLDRYHGPHKLWLVGFAEQANEVTRVGWPRRDLLARRADVTVWHSSHIAAELAAEG